MTGVVLGYINSGGIGSFVPGAALFSVDVNTAPGVASVQSTPVQGLTNVKVPLCSYLSGRKWKMERAYEFAPLDA